MSRLADISRAKVQIFLFKQRSTRLYELQPREVPSRKGHYTCLVAKARVAHPFAVREDESAVGHAVANVQSGRVNRPRSINERGDSGSTRLHHSSIRISTAVIIWTICQPEGVAGTIKYPSSAAKTGSQVRR
jgi:hypothetical protein